MYSVQFSSSLFQKVLSRRAWHSHYHSKFVENSDCTVNNFGGNFNVGPYFNRMGIVRTQTVELEKSRDKPEGNSGSCEKCSPLNTLTIYLCYGSLFIFGRITELIRPSLSFLPGREGYAPLFSNKETFSVSYVYRRVKDCFDVPICSVAGAMVTVVERITRDHNRSFEYTGKKLERINFSSYNYLGFSEAQGPCVEDAVGAIKTQGISTCSTRSELGNTTLHNELETVVARFVGQEDAIICGTGFSTNALCLPSILNRNCLVISDEKNHASIILGLRTSSATTRVFKHNDTKSLEKELRRGIINGQPRTHLPWEKIFIVIEGIFSMEGSLAPLPQIVELKKKYKAYLYIDEAHSIGVLGSRGRGICDYWGVNPKDVDILMGTLSKGFGAFGGYVAGPKEFIRMLRTRSQSQIYGAPMSPPIAQHVITSMKILMGEDGTDEGDRRIRQLRRNCRYLHQKLKQLGFVVPGHDYSPVVPVVLYIPSKLLYVARELFKKGIAVVMIGYPATALDEGRIRFTLCTFHTKEMLDRAVKEIAKLGEDILGRSSKLPRSQEEIIYEHL